MLWRTHYWTVPLLQTFEKHVPLTGGAFPEPWWTHIYVSSSCMSYQGQHGELSLTRLFHSSPTISFSCMIPRLTLISLYGPFDFEEKYTDVGLVISVVPQAEDLLLYRMSRSWLLQERELNRAESRIGSKQHRPINILITIGGTCL